MQLKFYAFIKMIIGICGNLAAGKDTAADYLVEKYHFHHYSLSDILRKMLIHEGKEITRENLTNLGNKLRERFGNDILARKVLKKLKRPAVVTSIRNLAELNAFKKEKDFWGVFIEAPAEVRYQRALARSREGEEKLSFREFLESESREKNDKETGQQLHLLKENCDYILDNSGSLRDFFQAIDNLLSKLKE